jgi:hypothetical protein
MSVSAAEVAALKAEADAYVAKQEHVDGTLQTVAEAIGYAIYGLRSIGADREELLHDVELIVRASGMWRDEIRTARDTLAKLGYGRDLEQLLTQLARRARPRPPAPFSHGHQCASVLAKAEAASF